MAELLNFVQDNYIKILEIYSFKDIKKSKFPTEQDHYEILKKIFKFNNLSITVKYPTKRVIKEDGKKGYAAGQAKYTLSNFVLDLLEKNKISNKEIVFKQ